MREDCDERNHHGTNERDADSSHVPCAHSPTPMVRGRDRVCTALPAVCRPKDELVVAQTTFWSSCGRHAGAWLAYGSSATVPDCLRMSRARIVSAARYRFL